ncbi:glycoside hydrolase family 16 protein [Fibrobacter sp. UBA2449]|uniref:glycoside hydrolase family 16 protein n=1 Tax=Fibrobacter sp. UBA2449 TaxID=1946529 RepID=UPI001566CC08|nr:family 16 glycosylhydrolase [Fibrobacter sp. UBA2449]
MKHLKKTIGILAVLAMAASVNAKDFSGAELYTKNEFTYGKFEARMKMAAISGTVSSMFLYQNGSEQASAERWVEVDIEVLGKNPSSFQSNIITGKAGAQKTSEKHHAVNPAADQAFHTYGIEWTPDYVRWTLDGEEVRKTVKGENKNQVENLIGTQGLRFNLWSSESADWVGQFDESKLPIFQFINWVKVYKYTPGQGENGSDFTLDWIDNFDTFDANRWAKGNWSFDGNRVDLTPNNIYSVDGMLILALTRKGQESFTGQVPQDTEPGPTPTSSSSSEITVPPSSSSATEAIQPVRMQVQNKQIRGTVNAKGARVNETRANDPRKRYRVNFSF